MPTVAITETEINPTYVEGEGGGSRTPTETEINPTYFGEGGGGWNVFTETELSPVLSLAYYIPPLDVTTSPATKIEETGATANGYLNEDSGIATTCYFQYGKTTGYGSTTPSQSKSRGEAFLATLTGLDEDTTYHFRAVATNAGGTAYGDDKTFTTGADVPHNYHYHLNIKNINLPYEDKDKTKELHAILKNLDPTTKPAGSDGEIMVELKYEPMG